MKEWQEGKEAIKTVYIHGARISKQDSSEHVTGRYVFTIELQGSERQHVLAVPTEEQRQKWCNLLEQAVHPPVHVVKNFFHEEGGETGFNSPILPQMSHSQLKPQQNADESEINFIEDNSTAKQLLFQSHEPNEERDDESCVVVNVPFCNQEGLSRSSDLSGNLEFSEVKEEECSREVAYGESKEIKDEAAKDKEIKNLKEIIRYEQNMREIEMEKKDDIIFSLKAELDKKNEVLSMLCAQVERLSKPLDTGESQNNSTSDPEVENQLRSMITQIQTIQEVVMGISGELGDEESRAGLEDDRSSLTSQGDGEDDEIQDERVSCKHTAIRFSSLVLLTEAVSEWFSESSTTEARKKRLAFCRFRQKTIIEKYEQLSSKLSTYQEAVDGMRRAALLTDGILHEERDWSPDQDAPIEKELYAALKSALEELDTLRESEKERMRLQDECEKLKKETARAWKEARECISQIKLNLSSSNMLDTSQTGSYH
ncbi:hypothetical protein GUITHDRAFT_114771 [Guillardia theta CCMP2712]|uniref:PH domain-containing protein n=1 Tax=Guillardia theta (strain CCMP2712) TaxID=905079 RepID=L1ITE5_GUITC|nr:hypothetical protein GUITHDRAFT_114771 [Guillardia theta CCMP2712]EKX39110.1 hypothetical protein GUITHDRAFT_114771 [Guillardia theta CCMP2712]|eukprot:XP_005826090.1 hypothetical protein GUITHDRAFT_114771 [Guillardia theta CCMP2712]